MAFIDLIGVLIVLGVIVGILYVIGIILKAIFGIPKAIFNSLTQPIKSTVPSPAIASPKSNAEIAKQQKFEFYQNKQSEFGPFISLISFFIAIGYIVLAQSIFNPTIFLSIFLLIIVCNIWAYNIDHTRNKIMKEEWIKQTIKREEERVQKQKEEEEKRQIELELQRQTEEREKLRRHNLAIETSRRLEAQRRVDENARRERLAREEHIRLVREKEAREQVEIQRLAEEERQRIQAEIDAQKSNIVYIAHCPAIKEMVKIGITHDNEGVKARMKSLQTSGVPLPYEAIHASKVKNAEEVEKRLHAQWKANRVAGNREIFHATYVELAQMIRALQEFELEDVTPN